MKNFLNTFIRIFRRKIFSKKTGGILNYLTLQISDREVAKELAAHKMHQ